MITNEELIIKNSVPPVQAYCTFKGTCLKSDLFDDSKYKDSKSGFLPKYPIKGEKEGDIIITSDTNETYIWINSGWEIIADSLDFNDDKDTRRKKIIPWPSKCTCCGASLHSYTCSYCGTEYPSYDYIMEEE